MSAEVSTVPVAVRVSAKINLFLGVGRRGEDGYHPLATVFEAIGLHDVVTATVRTDDAITVTTSGEDADEVPDDRTNLAVRAADLLRCTRRHPHLGVDLHIDKAIPVAGGMAGGSADAAGALLACSVAWGLDASAEELHDLATQLGSDVPFCLMGGVALGTGRGERLVPVLTPATHTWVVATAHEGLSTPSVFGRFDDLGDVHEVCVPTPLIAALATSDAEDIADVMGNDLQPAAVSLRPDLADVLAEGRRAGARTALVSGSGPTCVFLALDESAAHRIAAQLVQLPQVRTTRIATGPVAGAQLLPNVVGSARDTAGSAQ